MLVLQSQFRAKQNKFKLILHGLTNMELNIFVLALGALGCSPFSPLGNPGLNASDETNANTITSFSRQSS